MASAAEASPIPQSRAGLLSPSEPSRNVPKPQRTPEPNSPRIAPKTASEAATRNPASNDGSDERNRTNRISANSAPP